MANHILLSPTDLRHRAGLFSIEEVAALFSMPIRRFRYLLEAKRLVPPEARIGQRRRGYYTSAQIEQISRLIGEL
jgi:DNA-binding transcriptional MerR regulator